MKSKQVLDVQQMQHLRELGLETNNASMYWISYNGISASIPSNFHLPTSDNDYVICDAYTLQDILDLLPNNVDNELFLFIEKGKNKWRIGYTDKESEEIFEVFSYEELIDAGYKLLCWAIENKFVETNKNE